MSALAQLVVEIALLQATVYTGGPCPVRVTVRNASPRALVVNARLAVGYRNSTSRELFADVRERDSGSPVSIAEVDYDRNWPEASDYRTLPPGASITTTFDLLEWYPLPEGAFQLVVHYQADEPLARPPKGVVKGIFASPPLDLVVLPGAGQKEK